MVRQWWKEGSLLALDEFGTATDSPYYGIIYTIVNPTKYPQDSLYACTLSLKLLARFAPRHPSLGRGAIRWVEDFCAKTTPSMIKTKPK